MDLIKQSQLLPDKPTAADTADWYRLGDSVEKHGRHMKRQAVAAEYNSGREMNSWYLEIGITIDAGKQLLGEARKVELLNPGVDAVHLSQALPTSKAVREYAKAEPEVREVIQEQVTLNGKTYTAAEIKRLQDELAKVRGELSNQPEPIVDLDKHRAMTQGVQFGAVIGTFMDNLMSYQLSSRSFLDPEVVARHDVRLNELQAMLERYFNPTINSISPTTIDI